ncbi:MAG: hypothetical protein DHS20C09_07460 [marine bacterium B5-7]|nr:MAG: hypothetical protein DHS20C09_07460 [marine bacterium B5-7]
MKRSNLNFIIDTIAFSGFVLLTTTGVLMRYILPPGSGSYATIWDLDRHEWGDIHFWISVVFFSTLALHLVLHWRWITSVVTGQHHEASGMRAGLGVVGLIATIALAISPLLSPVEIQSKASASFSRHQSEERTINGSMTLEEVEEVTGVPADYILESLGLAETTSPTEKLGSLKKKQDIEVKDVRDIVNGYKN